jgi:hypothetical protein
MTRLAAKQNACESLGIDTGARLLVQAGDRDLGVGDVSGHLAGEGERPIRK